MKITKKQLEERVKNLEHDIEVMEQDYVHRDQLDDYCSEYLESYLAQLKADLQRNDPEENRRAFRVIEGAA